MNSNKITAIVITGLAALGLVSYFRMSQEERAEFIAGVKARLSELLDDAEGAGERAKGYMHQLKSTHPDNWLDKLVVIKKIVDEVKPIKEAANKFGQAGAAMSGASMSADHGSR
jgi:hypothetical protein